MTNIYTMEKWQADRDFKAQPGQEITGEIYEEMFNCLPPRRLPSAVQSRGARILPPSSGGAGSRLKRLSSRLRSSFVQKIFR